MRIRRIAATAMGVALALSTLAAGAVSALPAESPSVPVGAQDGGPVVIPRGIVAAPGGSGVTRATARPTNGTSSTAAGVSLSCSYPYLPGSSGLSRTPAMYIDCSGYPEPWQEYIHMTAYTASGSVAADSGMQHCVYCFFLSAALTIYPAVGTYTVKTHTQVVLPPGFLWYYVPPNCTGYGLNAADCFWVDPA